jgi:hypothetical protein
MVVVRSWILTLYVSTFFNVGFVVWIGCDLDKLVRNLALFLAINCVVFVCLLRALLSTTARLPPSCDSPVNSLLRNIMFTCVLAAVMWVFVPIIG